MSNFVLTDLLAIIFTAICLAILAISLIFKGKVLKRTSCGSDPTKKKDEDCGNKDKCSTCNHDEHKP